MKQFCAPWFTKKAVVALGPAPAGFSKQVQASVVEQHKTVKEALVNAEKTAWTRDQEVKKKRAEAVANAANVKAKIEHEKKKKEFTAAKEKAEAEGGDAPEEPAEPAAVEPDFTPDEEPNWEEKKQIDTSDIICTFRPRVKQGLPAKTGEVQPDVSPDALARVYDTFSLPTEGASVRSDNRWLEEDAEAPAPGGEGFNAVEYSWSGRQPRRSTSRSTRSRAR